MYEKRPHLVLLDLMLPGIDGIELMQEILEIDEVPVIFLSAYGQDQIIARAFDMGAADYVVKPFSPTELAARIRGALRKWVGPDPLEPFVVGELVIDYVTRQGDPCRSSGSTDCHRVPDAGRTLTKCRSGVDLRVSAEKNLGCGGLRRSATYAHSHKHLAPQARRRRRQPRLYLHRAAHRLPHGKRRYAGNGSARITLRRCPSWPAQLRDTATEKLVTGVSSLRHAHLWTPAKVG